MDKIGALFAPAPTAQATVRAQPATPAPMTAAAPKPDSIRAQAAKLLVAGGTIYVRRGGSLLRETEKSSGKTLKKLAKGTAVTVVAVDGGWTQVRDGDAVGWMRTSVLGPQP
jgi:uncharacterized protein YgiM (DUF1202 family)